MLRSILVAVDESTAAQRAVDLAIDLAVSLGADVKALAVIDPNVVHPNPRLEGPLAAARSAEDVRILLETSATRLLEAVSGRCRARGLDVTIARTTGSPQAQIVEHAENSHLLVLGRKGISLDAERGPGAVATYVLRQARAPRLFIDETARLPKRIFVGFDGSPDARRALSVAAEIALKTRYPLTVFHASEDATGGRILEHVERVVGPDPRPALVELVAAPLSVCLEQLVERPDTLFVLGARGNHRVADRLLGTLTESLHRDTRATLLVCGGPPRATDS